ncbi:MAG: hypothetical protein DMF62_03015 [Acidobacteria bacterium]|nr:MAG: hypothetical protein DMF62_03015 [Acidobacteriota bacterium]
MKHVWDESISALLILLGIFSAAFGLKGFLLSSHFIDGGVTGISMLVSNVSGYSLPFLLIVFNLPFIFTGYQQLGKRFAIKSVVGIVGLALCLEFVKFPDVTPDKLLTAIFGGLFIGAGIGLAMRGGSVLDGTEIAALLISKRSHLLRVGDVILILNVLIFLAAAYLISIDAAMYSILTYAAATKALDFLLNGVEQYMAVMIISPQNEKIKAAIIQRLQRGVTVFHGRGGMGSTGEVDDDREILYCVITRLEIGGLRSLIEEFDENAFVTTNPLSDVAGGLISRTDWH